MKRILLTALALLAPNFAIGLAQAQTPSDRATGVYVRGGAGVSWAETVNQSLTYNPFFVSIAPLDFERSTEFGNGLALSGAIGFQYARTRTELEYRRMTPDVTGGFNRSTLGDTPFALSGDEKFTVQALMSNVYLDLPNQSPLTPYIGVGVGGARVESQSGARDAAFAYQGRAGVELRISPKLSLGAEYVYFRTLDLVYGPADEELVMGGPIGPRADGAPFVSSSVMGTIRILF
ncbi:MAG: P44/Msp2 family outer membrane protein [Parvularculaceae bacterium]